MIFRLSNAAPFLRKRSFLYKKRPLHKETVVICNKIRLAAVRRIKPALSRWAIARSSHDPFVLQPRNANAFFQSAVGRSSILKRRLNPLKDVLDYKNRTSSVKAESLFFF